jgi:hypothetical protein
MCWKIIAIKNVLYFKLERVESFAAARTELSIVWLVYKIEFVNFSPYMKAPYLNSLWLTLFYFLSVFSLDDTSGPCTYCALIPKTEALKILGM